MPQQSRAQRRRQPVRSAQSVARQQPARRPPRVIEPVDYSRDYAAVRLDLRRIALWATLLFVGMAALYFVL
jgi:hypothetical protein